MNLPLPAVLRPDHRRPPSVDLTLAIIPFLLWFLAGCLQFEVLSARDAYHLALLPLRWRLDLPWGPLIAGLVGFALFYRAWRHTAEDEVRQALQTRLFGAFLFTAPLLLVRLLAIWPDFLRIFPYTALLYSPHADWALGLVYLVLLTAPFSSRSADPRRHERRIALILFGLGSLVFLCYTIYFCQVSMLHGDEGQYLRVTQSLLHDGDMDLANNLDPADTAEFHVLEFGVHKAPASPEGKLFSVHPIGLSILLLPAYWVGLQLWANPRLAAALFMALLAAGCLPFAFLWLVRLGISRASALAAVLIAASTVPLLLFTNQLFPEVPALFVTLCLLAVLWHWQVPGGGYRSLGPAEPLHLLILALLLGTLPFLHARYTPIAALGGVLLLLQAWHSPRRRLNLSLIAAIAVLALAGLIAFNYTFSGDWLGPFRPGNAWADDALDIDTWLISLPGHWLFSRKGLLNPSPIYFFALFGWVALARQRDRRLLILLLYLATAGVNGLHPLWDFGFCFPARFLVTALPVLLLGLAFALPRIAGRPVTIFLAAIALVISLETVGGAVHLPEMAYDGRNLLERSINQYYPWQIHFFFPGEEGFPLVDAAFWSLLLAALCLVLLGKDSLPPLLRGGILAIATLLPFAWGQTSTYDERLLYSTAGFDRFLVSLDPLRASSGLRIPLNPKAGDTGEESPAGGYFASQSRHKPGILASASFPRPFRPGKYRLELPDLQQSGPSGEVTAHIMVSRQYTVSALSLWAVKENWLLTGGQKGSARALPFLHFAGPQLAYAFVGFPGQGGLSFKEMSFTYFPFRRTPVFAESERFPAQPSAEPGNILFGANAPSLQAGTYRARFLLDGSAWTTLFERRPRSVIMAVYDAPIDEDLAKVHLDLQVRNWFEQDRERPNLIDAPAYLPPHVEVLEAPWWLSIPFVGEEHYQFEFTLTEPRNVWLLIAYEGELDLALEEVILYRLENARDL